MSVIYIDGLTIRLASDLHNKFNPLYAFGGSQSGVLALRDVQENHLLLPCDAEGNVIVTPGRRYQIVTVTERRCGTPSKALDTNVSPARVSEKPALRRGDGGESQKERTSPHNPPQDAVMHSKGQDKSETAKTNGHAREATRDACPQEALTMENRTEGDEKAKNEKKSRRSQKSPKHESNKNPNTTNNNEVNEGRTSPREHSRGEDRAQQQEKQEQQQQQQKEKQKQKQRNEEDEKERKHPRTSTHDLPSPREDNLTTVTVITTSPKHSKNSKDGAHDGEAALREPKTFRIERSSVSSGLRSPPHVSVRSPRSEMPTPATPPSAPPTTGQKLKRPPHAYLSSSEDEDDEDEEEMPVVVWHAQRRVQNYQKQEKEKERKEEEAEVATGRANVGIRNRSAKKLPPALSSETSSDSS